MFIGIFAISQMVVTVREIVGQAARLPLMENRQPGRLPYNSS
jgi:hypothetical protein